MQSGFSPAARGEVLARPERRLIAAMVCISLSAACLVGGYEFARSAAASLFIDAFHSGPMVYAMSVVPVFMALIIYCYGRVLTRLGSLWTLQASLGFFAAAFFAAYLALCTGSKTAVAVFYVFAETYIVILVEQFWSFINSSLNQANAKMFNGPILGCASIGPILAGLFANRFASVWGSKMFVLLTSLSLVPTAVFSYAAYRLAGEPRPSAAESGAGGGPLRLRLILEHKVLLFMALVIALSQFFATATNLRVYALVETAMPNKDVRTAYLAMLFARVNLLAFFMQFVITPLLLRRLRLSVVLIGIPVVHMIMAGLMLGIPALPVAAWSLIIFKGLDYSIFRASKELLYIPLSFDVRYRAKQVVDAFTYRFSKGAVAGGISLARMCLGALPGWAFPAISLAAAGAWTAAAVPLGRYAKAGQTKQ